LLIRNDCKVTITNCCGKQRNLGSGRPIEGGKRRRSFGPDESSLDEILDVSADQGGDRVGKRRVEARGGFFLRPLCHDWPRGRCRMWICPNERFRVRVVGFDIGVDGAFELRHAGRNVSADARSAVIFCAAIRLLRRIRRRSLSNISLLAASVRADMAACSRTNIRQRPSFKLVRSINFSDQFQKRGGGSASPCPLPDNNPGVSFARIKRP
jgi:hypothetical protein